MLGVVINAAVRGWWIAAGLTLLFDVLMNGYPVMLQRYNRALLYARFPIMQADEHRSLDTCSAAKRTALVSRPGGTFPFHQSPSVRGSARFGVRSGRARGR
jgi:hypothetical protein